MNTNTQKLASDFPMGSAKAWRDLAQKAIKDEDFDATLVKHSEDGIARGPLFTTDTRGTSQQLHKSASAHLAGRPWHIGVTADHPDIKEANKDILDDLKGGASSILVDVGRHGVAVRNKSDMQRLLTDVHVDLVPFGLLPSEDNFEAAALLAAHYQSYKQAENLYASLGLAPLDLNTEAASQLISCVRWCAQQMPHWKALSINARAAHEAGSSPAQELGLMLAVGAAYIRTMLAGDMSVEDALSSMDIHLASDQDGHQSITKFRAARLLWAKLSESFGASNTARAARLHAISSERMMAQQDPWSNMIRLSAASFGAVCGGADTITILPFTHALGIATPFARRISRNMQLMMMEESHLGHVSDPGHGSYMHERLSHDLAQTSWEIFQHLESLGGWETKPARNWLKKEIAKTYKTRMQKINNNELLLVGVNQFAKPDVRKAEVRRRPVTKPRNGNLISATSFEQAIVEADNGHLIPLHEGKPFFQPVRLSEQFDKGETL